MDSAAARADWGMMTSWWRPVAQQSMRSPSIVEAHPTLDHSPDLRGGVEDLANEKLNTEACFEALGVAILSWAHGLNKAVFASTAVIHSCIAFATNYGSLSDRMCRGTPG